MNSGLPGSLSREQAERLASLPPHLRAWDEDEHGCWIAHKRQANGYAVNTSFGGRPPKGMKGNLYRLLYILLIGPIPEGKELDHLCNRGHEGCANPFHCKPATRKENLLRDGSRSFTKELAEATHCVRGHEFTPGNTIYPNKSNRGKVRTHWRGCKTCREEQLVRFRERHGKDELNRRRRDHYQRNRAKILAQKKEYRARKRQEEAS